MDKCCEECPWIVRNQNNDSLITHSKRLDRPHNCHMKTKHIWDFDPELECVGHKKFKDDSKKLS